MSSKKELIRVLTSKREHFRHYLKDNVREEQSIELKFDLMLMKADISGQKSSAFLLQTKQSARRRDYRVISSIGC